MAKKSKVSSDQVISAIKVLWPSPAWTWFEEVPDATGGRASRRADAIGVSCYPSRGIFARGIEVKVSRTDWRNELKNPAKSANFQRNISDFYLAAPPGVAELDEIPETWGYIEVANGKASVVKKALFAEKNVVEWDFAAALLRHVSTTYDKRLAKEIYLATGASPLAKELADVRKWGYSLQRDLTLLKYDLDESSKTLVKYRKIFKTFFEKTGLNLTSDSWGPRDLDLVAALKTMASPDFKLTPLIQACDSLLANLKKVDEVKQDLNLDK
jgi:hypothetical protein